MSNNNVCETTTASGRDMAGVDMSVNLGGLVMKNPVTVASGTFGSGSEFSDFFDLSNLGALTTKGVSLHPWEGNKTPRIAETASGMLNSIGLQNPGVEAFIERDLSWLSTQDVPVIVNVSGHSCEEYVHVIEALEQSGLVDAYELNISCPNVDSGGMAFGVDPKIAASIVEASRAVTRQPLIVKLSPNVTDISEVARACEAAGADALSLINTLLGMAIDVRTRKPKLARVVGGLSGPAIKPVALRMVMQAYGAVSVPILGMGGISSAEDAIEFMLAGATSVAIGTANFVNPHTCLEVIDGIEKYCNENGFSSVSELTGALEF